MAIGDKLVNLEDLKEVRDDLIENEIGELKSAFNESAVYATDNLSIFEKGQINVLTGENYTDSDNYRSKSYIDKSIGIIHIDNGYRLRILLYSGDTYVGVWKDGSITQTTQWITDSETQIWDLQKTYNVRIIFNKDQTTLTESDLVHIKIFKSLVKEAPDNYIGVRSLTGNIKNNLTYGKYEVQSITFGSENRYINCNNGVISDAGGLNAHVSDYIDCSTVPAIRLTASPYYSFACMAFYNSAKAFIISYPSSSSHVNYWMEEIAVPADAKYVVFGNNSAFSGTLAVKIEFMTAYATELNRKWIGKKWACVGDSLTEINDRATMRYMDYIQIATGIKPYNMGVSGTGYANGHANSKAFIDRIVNVPTDSDVVTIFGSNNDMFGDELPVGDPTDSGTTTLCGFINGTIDALYTAFPQAILGIITPCPWENIYPSATTELGQKGIAYSQALVDICKRRGIPCLDLFHCSGMRPWEAGYRALYYTHDEGGGVHPDENGHKILASHFKAFLEELIL